MRHYRKPVKNYVEPILYEGQFAKPRQRIGMLPPQRRDYYVSNKQIMPRPRPKYKEPLPHSIYMNNIVRGVKCSDEAGDIHYHIRIHIRIHIPCSQDAIEMESQHRLIASGWVDGICLDMFQFQDHSLQFMDIFVGDQIHFMDSVPRKIWTHLAMTVISIMTMVPLNTTPGHVSNIRKHRHPLWIPARPSITRSENGKEQESANGRENEKGSGRGRQDATGREKMIIIWTIHSLQLHISSLSRVSSTQYHNEQLHHQFLAIELNSLPGFNVEK